MSTMKLVKIIWKDSKGLTTGWEFKEDIEEIPPVEIGSVGFLLSSKKDYKTLAHSVSSEQVLGRLTIPNGCIVSCEAL